MWLKLYLSVKVHYVFLLYYITYTVTISCIIRKLELWLWLSSLKQCKSCIYYLRCFCFLTQHYTAAYWCLSLFVYGFKRHVFWNLFLNSFTFYFILRLSNYIFPQIKLWKTCISDKSDSSFLWSLETFNLLELHFLRRNIWV